ncbi:ABC transporter permease [Microbacterium sp. X-17]|uniref:ABC transporter permease n=1 Tax=Microbacterium sp. X-17 TaxID=3144404 RepID=UPI0031F58533
MTAYDDRRDAARAAIPSLDVLRAEALERGRATRRFGVWYAADHLLRATRARGWVLVLSAFAQPLVYLMVFALGVSALVPALVDSVETTVPYADFIAPAFLMTAAMTVATVEFSSAVRRGFSGRRMYATLASTPVRPGQVMDGIVLAGLFRMLLVSAGFYLVLVVFRLVPTPNTGWLSVGIAALGGLAYGMPLMAWTTRLRRGAAWFPTVREFQFVVLFLLSGTVYPLAALPGWLTWIGWFSPLWHASELGRIATYGRTADPLGIVGHLVFLVAFAVVGYVLARRAFVRRVRE